MFNSPHLDIVFIEEGGRTKTEDLDQNEEQAHSAVEGKAERVRLDQLQSSGKPGKLGTVTNPLCLFPCTTGPIDQNDKLSQPCPKPHLHV